MNAKDHMIVDFVKGEDKFFLIPYYQRKYTWKAKDQVKELFNDLNEFIDSGNKEFILGAIITKRNNNKKQQTQYILVDGQQRITTFLIMICALIKANKNETEEGREHLRDLRNIIKTEDISKFKLERIEDQNIISQLLNDEIDINKYSNNNYIKVFKFLLDKFTKIDFEHQKNFYKKAMCKIKIANMELDEDEDENLVFESFNSKGKPLSSSELIKNHLMMSLENNNVDKELIKKFENNFLENFLYYEDGSNSIDDFWRQYINLKTGKLPTKGTKDMYLKFKEKFYSANINECFINEIQEEKIIWNYLMSLKNDNKGNKTTETKDRIIYNQNMLSYYSIIHSIIKRNSKVINGQLEILNQNIVNQAVSYISKLVVFRTLLSCGRVEGNREWAKLGYKLFNSSNDFNDDFKALIKDELNYSTSAYRMPSWDEIIQIEKRDLYTHHKDNLKWIFASIEENISKTKKSLDEISKLQIEHIFPQRPTAEQIKEWEIQCSDDWYEWENTLGNLSLIEQVANAKGSNNVIDKKQEVLKDHSYLKINKMIFEYKVWNLDTLKNRAREILNYIKQIWDK